jgi:hypothetical protein
MIRYIKVSKVRVFLLHTSEAFGKDTPGDVIQASRSRCVHSQ